MAVDLFDAIKGRRSIRRFKPTPIPKKLLSSIIPELS
jgi:nitroreductase